MIIRRATAADAADLAEMMGESFMADPVSCWVFPDPDLRRKLHPDFFRVFVDLALRDGAAVTTADLAGVTLWFDEDPASADQSDPGEVGALFHELLGTEFAGRFDVLGGLMADRHPHHARHAYLAFAAVHPSRQGQGIGEALLRHHLAEVDGTGLPGYVEASSTRNARLYERVGFRHEHPTFTLPDGPTLYPMWRPAAG